MNEVSIEQIKAAMGVKSLIFLSDDIAALSLFRERITPPCKDKQKKKARKKK